MVVVLDRRPCLSPIDIGELLSFVLPAFIPGLGEYSIDTSLAVHGLVVWSCCLISTLYFSSSTLPGSKTVCGTRGTFQIDYRKCSGLNCSCGWERQPSVITGPSYQKFLGYSPEELSRTTGIDQIHPDDRQKVLEAAAEARRSGVGRSVEYRIRHKDGRWVPLESTASVVRKQQGGSRETP